MGLQQGLGYRHHHRAVVLGGDVAQHLHGHLVHNGVYYVDEYLEIFDHDGGWSILHLICSTPAVFKKLQGLVI